MNPWYPSPAEQAAYDSHRWDSRDPVFGIVVWCSDCTTMRDSDAAYEPCTGEQPEPTDAQIEQMTGGVGAAEQQAAAWQQHRESHR